MTETEPGAANGVAKGPDSQEGGKAVVPQPQAQQSGAGASSAGGASTAGGTSGAQAKDGDASGDDLFLGIERPIWIRFFYMLGFAVVAWVVFWFVLALALVQLIYRVIKREPWNELRNFSRDMIQYLWEVLAFITFAREKKPFPFEGKFPKTEDTPE